MGRPKLHVFGPSLLDTVERGDIFLKNNRILRVIRKEYQADLTLVYVCENIGGYWREVRLSETTLQYPGAAGYIRAHKTPRTILDLKEFIHGTA